MKITKGTARAIASHTSTDLADDRVTLRDRVDLETEGALDTWKLDQLTDWVQQELRERRTREGGQA